MSSQAEVNQNISYARSHLASNQGQVASHDHSTLWNLLSKIQETIKHE